VVCGDTGKPKKWSVGWWGHILVIEYYFERCVIQFMGDFRVQSQLALLCARLGTFCIDSVEYLIL
jgi:hypothetical protein